MSFDPVVRLADVTRVHGDGPQAVTALRGGVLRPVNGLSIGSASLVIDVPWLVFGSVLVGLPLPAALLAGLCVRARVVLTRRLT